MADLKPETITMFKDLVLRKGEFLQYLAKHGNDFERAAASVILEAGVWKGLNQLITKYKIGTGTIRYGKEPNMTIRCWIFSSNLISDPVISITNLPEYPQQNQVQDHEMVEYWWILIQNP